MKTPILKERSLTQARLKELLSYDPKTGVFHRLVTRPNSRAGDVAGTKHGSPNPYIVIMVDGRRYLAHRLAFLFVTGTWPPEEVDHRDGDGSNNRWKNLRACAKSHNLANAGRRRNNTSGFKGVSWCRASNKWRAQIGFGVARYLGCFDRIEDAASAYGKAARKFHGEFARLA